MRFPSSPTLLVGSALLALAGCRFRPPASQELPGGDSQDSEGGVDSPAETALPQDSAESDPPSDSDPVVDSGDSQWVEPMGTLFACGEWETGPAPTGLIRVRDADVTIGYETFDGHMQPAYDVAAADTDGDGCSELMFSTNPGPHTLWLLPGTLAEENLIDERGVASITGLEDPDDHQMRVAVAGDTDGDGQADEWLVGATSMVLVEDGFNGAVYLYSAPLEGAYQEEDAEVIIYPPTGSLRFAHALDASDGNMDGVDDAVVGWSDGRGVGQCWTAVFDGPLDPLTMGDDATALIDGDCAFGLYLTMQSDLNADGLADLVPTDYDGLGYQGMLHVFYGPVSGVLEAQDSDRVVLGARTDESFGHGIAGGGDANLDGYDDLLVAANTGSPARVYLVLGPVAEDDTLEDLSAAVFHGNGRLGFESVSLAQDMDADGHLDPAMGDSSVRDLSPEPGGAGYLFYGPVSGTIDVNDADAIFYEDDYSWSGGNLGAFVTGLGDTDGDGYDDLLMGNSGRGPAYIFRGGPR